uniref:Transposase (Putative), gypsy type n=1 Tax=Tanacetum cinerariifolium TaxID=118510 RepID=A0A6L2P4B5_TANCI|nr:transposase (putative), gypsy type [Tanacetum cinerariifolium]
MCTLSKNDLKDLVKTYRIPLDLHPRLHDPGFIMDHLPGDAIGIYFEFLWFSGIRIPFSTFLLSVLKYFKVHISQLVPLGLNKVVSFEVMCHGLNIVPIVTLFRVFQCLCKQGVWFSFSKHRNTEDVCIDNGPSSLKKWKDKFFLIDRRAIPDYLTWRHSCSCVSNNLPTDGYDRNDVERLCARLICLCKMREEVLVHSRLISVWFNKECDLFFQRIDDNAGRLGESYHLSLPLLERVSSHTTAPATKGAMSPLPTPDEIDASLPDPRLTKKSKVPSRVRVYSASDTVPEPSRTSKKEEAKEKSEAGSSTSDLERDESTSTRADSALTPRLGKRLCAPLSMAIVNASRPSHVGTSVHASTSGRSFSLGVACGLLSAVVSGHAGMSRAECSAGFPWAKLNSRNNRLQEKFDQKAGYVKVLCWEVATLDGKIERIQKDCDGLGPKNRELRSQKDVASDKVKELQTELTDAKVASIGLSEELSKTDAKLFDQASGYKDVVDGLKEEVTRFVSSGMESLVRKLLSSDEFHAALAHVASLGINYGVERGLRMGRTNAEFEVAAKKVSNFHIGAKVDFDKALVDFPTTPFPFLGKIIAAAGGTLPEVTQVLPDRHIRSVTSIPVAPPIANKDANQVPLEHASDDTAASI